MNTQPAPPTTTRSGSRRAIVIATAVIGGLLLIGIGGTAIAQVVRGAEAESQVQRIDASGLSSVRMEVSAADVTVTFGDVDDAVFEATGTRGEWRVQRSGDELVVQDPRGRWFFGGWIFGGGGCFGLCAIDGEVATLTLPKELERGEGIDASIDVASGALRTEGAFRDLDLDLSAGSVHAAGSARAVDVEMSAGRLTADLADVTAADFDLSAGSVDAVLRGSAPDRVDLEVSAGSFELTLPDTDYRFESSVAAGSVDNRLRTSPSSSHRVTVDLSAGSVRLNPGEVAGP